MPAQEKRNTPLGEEPMALTPPDFPPSAYIPSEVASIEEGHGDNPQSRSHVNVERPQSFAGEAFFVAVICSSQLLTQAGLALSIVPQHIIARSFGIDNQPAKLSWFSAGYSLTVGTFILVAGRLGDIFGHKRFFVGGFLWFGV
jgi:hypothetical protein